METEHVWSSTLLLPGKTGFFFVLHIIADFNQFRLLQQWELVAYIFFHKYFSMLQCVISTGETNLLLSLFDKEHTTPPTAPTN